MRTSLENCWLIRLEINSDRNTNTNTITNTNKQKNKQTKKTSAKPKIYRQTNQDDPNYGRPDSGSLSAMRAAAGEAKMRSDICDVCDVIFQVGFPIIVKQTLNDLIEPYLSELKSLIKWEMNLSKVWGYGMFDCCNCQQFLPIYLLAESH